MKLLISVMQSTAVEMAYDTCNVGILTLIHFCRVRQVCFDSYRPGVKQFVSGRLELSTKLFCSAGAPPREARARIAAPGVTTGLGPLYRTSSAL
jgi:hypothetical protein